MQPKTNMGDTPEDCLVDLSDTLEKLQEGLRKRTREDFMQTQAIQDFKDAKLYVLINGIICNCLT